MKRTTSLPVVLLAVAISFGASACGDDGNDSASNSTSPDTAPGTTAPTESTESPATTETPGSTAPAEEPTVESAADVVVGLSETDAAAAAEGHGWILRVTREDGEDLPATMDLRPNRVNVEVTGGVVTGVLNIG